LFTLVKEAVFVRSGCWVHGFHAILLRTPSSWVGPSCRDHRERRSRHQRCGEWAFGSRGAVSAVSCRRRAGARPSEVPSRGVAVDARRGKAENESAPPYAVEASIDRYYFRGNSRNIHGVSSRWFSCGARVASWVQSSFRCFWRDSSVVLRLKAASRAEFLTFFLFYFFGCVFRVPPSCSGNIRDASSRGPEA
jgi:hypothetical protein